MLSAKSKGAVIGPTAMNSVTTTPICIVTKTTTATLVSAGNLSIEKKKKTPLCMITFTTTYDNLIVS